MQNTQHTVMLHGYRLTLLRRGTDGTVTYAEGKGEDGSQLLAEHLQLSQSLPERRLDKIFRVG